jgi:hypothetical protein
MEEGPSRTNEKTNRTGLETMSQNATFDDVLAVVFGTLDTVYQLHAPEDPESENDPGMCKHCKVEFPCQTEEIILEGLAHVAIAMEQAKTSESSSAESEQPSA